MKEKKPLVFNPRKYSPNPHIGVDEVGRGCLAGPVVAAAVILKHDKDNSLFADSKVLNAGYRKKTSLVIHENHLVSIAWATPEEIDDINIHWASLLAMKRAVLGLGVSDGHVLVDGRFTIPDLVGFKQSALVKGDSFAPPISAASIVAKVYRDEWMEKLSLEYPEYGFEKHKGYGTQVHRRALQKNGTTIIHRKSFSFSSP